MDLLNSILNIVIPPISILALLIFIPFYFFLKFIAYIVRSIFKENLAGKVVLIAGASSRMGKHLAYEYAKRGAYLALAARRIKSLREVADKALKLCSPGVIAVQTDVSKVEECERLINEAINTSGYLIGVAVDYLVLCSGETHVTLFEEIGDVTKLNRVMDINFVMKLMNITKK